MIFFKNDILHKIWFLVCAILIILAENFFLIRNLYPKIIGYVIFTLLIVFVVFINFHPNIIIKINNKKLHRCAGGLFLIEQFLITLAVTLIILFCHYIKIRLNSNQDRIYSIIETINFYGKINLAWIYFVELVIFWNGITRIYLFSNQIGVKLRVIGALCGMIPILHLIALFKIIQTVSYEIKIEVSKEEINEKRKSLQICKTKYPIVMIHGVFFRDFKHFNYWGRIPAELEFNGAQIFYGNHESATSVIDSAEELACRIKEILKETGAEKVNIIAHSKGGLDCRYMISKLGMEDYVASLTTINTPHRGCEFADYLLGGKVSESVKKIVSNTYNSALLKLGDKQPDFMAAISDLTSAACKIFNENVKDSEKVYYQSVGSILKFPKAGRFPLNFSYPLVRRFDGPNDGLVGEKSFPWGSKFTLIKTKGIRGVSHGDMIDLNRENFSGFDVREFFVQLVSDLREKGY